MLKTLLYEGSEANPTFQVQGFGTMDLDSAKKGAISRIEQALGKLKNNPDARDWANAKHILYDTGVIEAMLTAVSKNHPE